MDIHKNARLTLRSREALVQAVAQSMSIVQAARAFRVTAKTAAKWVRRYRELCSGGLLDRSSRPQHSPRATHPLMRDLVVDLRRQHRPAYHIAQATGLSPATVSRILRRARLSRWRDLFPAPPVLRYEHPHPGDLLHLDIKGMTRYRDVTLRGDGRLRGTPRHAGTVALHVAIDDHSRLAFARLLPDQKTHTTIDFLHQAIEFYQRHGIHIRRLLTDNGSSYRSHQFRGRCAELNIGHQRTRPYTPRTNGKAERFIQTALREWAYAQQPVDLAAEPESDTRVFFQFMGSLRDLTMLEVFRRTHNSQAEILTHSNRHHVAPNQFADMDASVETARH